MINVGNDIVSLKPARSKRFTQKAYYFKILSQTEEDYFHRQLAGRLSFGNYVWLLWSIKEAAYKYFRRRDNDLLFNPQKITVQNIALKQVLCPLPAGKFPIESKGFENDKFIEGFASMQNDGICTRSLIAEDFIFSVVSDDLFLGKIYWGIQQIDAGDYRTQSAAVRSFVTSKLKDVFPGRDFIIKKNAAAVPSIVCGNEQFPVSFTHHEKYIAYAFISDD